MMSSIAPGMILLLGALVIPFIRGSLAKGVALALPILSAIQMAMFPEDMVIKAEVFGFTLTLTEVDNLSLVWGYVFHLAAFISVIYQLHVKDNMQDVSGIMYAGAAICAVFARDLITLFVFWELTAVTSVFLIYARRTQRSAKVGTRYLIIQVASGVILLFGVALWYRATGSIVFGEPFTDEWQQVGMFVDEQSRHPVNLGAWLILLAFGIKAAFPFLHNWLQDSYPEATVTGTVFLSAFTTKLAIYALARGFAGTSFLVPVGLVMTLFPIVFAVIENDLRKVLAYSLNNQLGYMVVGVGIGTQLALNGAASHAFAHILYKGLLFMAMGAVLFRTGTIKANELGGLYKSMPLTCVFCIVGSLSISGFPLFSGFVTKSMTMTAAFQMDQTWLFVGLLIASAGVVDHSGIKIPFFAFFAHDSGKRVKEAPLNMLIAMGIAAFFCIALGFEFFYQHLYGLLPFEVREGINPDGTNLVWHNYSASHVLTYLQLLLFAALAFVVLMKTNLYPPELSRINLDTDIIYRRFLPRLLTRAGVLVSAGFFTLVGRIRETALRGVSAVGELHKPQMVFGEPWSTNRSAMWAVVMLGAAMTIAAIV